jgi:hypothetical protein
MESTVATLLLLTSSVVLACVVIGFAVNTLEQATNTASNPDTQQISHIQSELGNLINQTQTNNGTIPQLPDQQP